MNLTNEQEIRLRHLSDHMEICKLYANYWVAMATTGATTRRIVSRGNKRLTPEELTESALDTAKTHINNFRETSDEILKLLRE